MEFPMHVVFIKTKKKGGEKLVLEDNCRAHKVGSSTDIGCTDVDASLYEIPFATS